MNGHYRQRNDHRAAHCFNSVSFVCFLVFLIILALVPLSLSLARADIHTYVMHARITLR